MKRIPPTLFVLCFVAACGPSEPSTGDEPACTGKCDGVSPTASSFVQENVPYYWADSSYDAFRNASTLVFGETLLPSVDDSDPLVAHIQVWMDRIDAIVRADVLAKTGKPLAAPRPRAKVLVSNQAFNAWVSPVPVCLDVSYGDGNEPGSMVLLDTEAMSAVGAPGSEGCVRPGGYSAAGFASFWNQDRPACGLTIEGASADVTGTQCSRDGIAGAEQLVAVAATPYVQFTSDLLAGASEELLVTTIAHELAHYYRGHATAKGAARYDYWYTRDAAQKKMPVPASDAAELSAAYQEIVYGGPYQAPFASHYSARLRSLLLLGVVPLLAERNEVDFACRAAKKALGPWVDEITTAEVPSAEARDAFVLFEQKLVACAPQLELAGEPGARALSASAVLSAAQLHRLAKSATITLHWHESLGAFLDRLQVTAKDLDDKAARLTKRLRENQIGLYTVEQEADDLSLALVTRLGITSEEVLDAWLLMMRNTDALMMGAYTPEEIASHAQAHHEIDTVTCTALLADGFTELGIDGKRRPVTVTLGDLDEPHHSTCYRVFNLYRQAQLMKYKVGPRQPVPGPSWEELRAHAAELVASAQP